MCWIIHPPSDVLTSHAPSHVSSRSPLVRARWSEGTTSIAKFAATGMAMFISACRPRNPAIASQSDCVKAMTTKNGIESSWHATIVRTPPARRATTGAARNAKNVATCATEKSTEIAPGPCPKRSRK